MGRRGKIDEYKLAEHLKTGVTDRQAGVDFGNIVSRQSITLKRAKFEKLDQSDPRWLPPRAELVTSKRGRPRKSLAKREVAPLSKTLPDYQLREYIQQIVRQEIKEAIANLLRAITGFDDVVAERDYFKRRLASTVEEQREYWAGRQEGHIAPPLITKSTDLHNNLTEHIDCAPVKLTKSELNKLPLLNIREGAFLFRYSLT